MPDLVHLLTHAGGDLRLAAVACGSSMAQHASFDRRVVTCPGCLGTCTQQPNNPTTLKPNTADISEKQWLQQVVDFARSQGYLVYHPHESRKSAPGWPDLALAKAGCPLWLVEAKSSTGQLSGHQQHWLAVLGQVTVVQVAVWRPEDWPRILAVLG